MEPMVHGTEWFLHCIYLIFRISVLLAYLSTQRNMYDHAYEQQQIINSNEQHVSNIILLIIHEQNHVISPTGAPYLYSWHQCT